MKKCLTKPLVAEYSGCLVETPACDFAVRFGFSYLCEHPRHADFHPSPERQLDHKALYNELRTSRRNEYIYMAKKFIEDMEHEPADCQRSC